MNKISRKERKARAEQKREAIRLEIWTIMCGAEKLKNLDPVVTINKAIAIMERENPQESHFIKGICAEIRHDIKAFTHKMINNYGVRLIGEKQ